MGRRRSPARLGLISLILCLTLAGCTSFTTRLAGWYITRKIDSYLDLTSEQKSFVRGEVDELLLVVRRDELPAWLNLFRGVRNTIDQGATDAKLHRLQDRYDALMERAVDTLTPKIAIVLAKLDDDQIDHFEQRMLETLEETYEEQEGPEEGRREKRDEDLIEAIENITDDLSDSQRRIILDKVHSLPDEREIQYRVGKQRIHEGADFLRKHPGSAAIEAELRRLWATRYEVLGPGRGKEPRRAEQRDVLLTIDRTLTRDNRDHAIESINSLIRKAKRFLLTDGS